MNEIQRQMQQQIDARMKYQTALSFTNSIMLEFGIHDGNFLPDFLEISSSTNNRDAILHWILSQEGYDLKQVSDKKLLKVKLHRLLIGLNEEKGMLFPL